jgi:hypothetical protein
LFGRQALGPKRSITVKELLREWRHPGGRF